ncbi:MAG: hypothetical protein M1834_001860 [Cirrosporium novae-zelandiae]|nr:MAG: hypothetical protein M1834_001860 [Cirrosporium novae-zelandiae]
MHFQQLAAISLGFPLTSVAETVLGVYIFHRHGDRTPKSTPPANLTDLGYREVYTSGTYYRNRYVESNATFKIAGMNSDLVKQSQISVSTSDDDVLMNSAQGFLQGLYPPVGSSLGSETLRNGTVVESPLNGYQLIPIDTISSGTNSESSGWLQGSTDCAKAQVSSDEYYYTDDYTNLLNSTADFYKALTPMIDGVFTDDEISYKNAYTIFDLLNVASIHNSTETFNSSLLTDNVFFELRTLADHHEWELAYNASSEIRAVAGATLAAEILEGLNDTITGEGATKMNIQFGSYGTYFSFFGLAGLPAASPNFKGVPDYASSMVFELVTNSSTSSFPSTDDISVRFLFHNGTASNASEPTVYPLFGQEDTLLPWSTFADNMNNFAIGTQLEWCTACGNTTGTCSIAATSTGSSSSSNAAASSSNDHGISRAVAGVIGAMVTLAVIFGAEALILLVGGYRLVNKKRLATAQSPPPQETTTQSKA